MTEPTREARPARYAICSKPRCDGAPLVPTFAWSGSEFICLECGELYAWLDPEGADATVELHERYDALLAEWRADFGPHLIGGGAMLGGCDACRERGEPHWNHATDEEKAAHRDALARLEERTKGA